MRCFAFFLFQPVADRLPFFSHSSRLPFFSHSDRLSFFSHSDRLTFFSHSDRLSAIPFFLFSLPIGNPPYLFFSFFCPHLPQLFSLPLSPARCRFFSPLFYRLSPPFFLFLPPHATFFLPSLKCPHRPQLSFLLSLSPARHPFFSSPLRGEGDA